MLESLDRLLTARDIKERAKVECLYQKNFYDYAKSVVRHANQANLSNKEIVELAIHLGIKVFPRNSVYRNFLGDSKAVIAGLPNDWKASLCYSYFSLAYHNPQDLFEYIAVVPLAPGQIPAIVHHTPEGYVDPNWFNKIVPVLYKLSVEDNLKTAVKNHFKKQNLTLGQVNTINHFFKQDPILGIEGVCTKCYQVSLPRKGFGVRYLYKGEPADLPSGGLDKRAPTQRTRFFSTKYQGMHV